MLFFELNGQPSEATYTTGGRRPVSLPGQLQRQMLVNRLLKPSQTSVEILPGDPPALDHDPRRKGRMVDICERIAGEQHEISHLPHSHGADRIGSAEKRGDVPRAGLERLIR